MNAVLTPVAHSSCPRTLPAAARPTAPTHPEGLQAAGERGHARVVAVRDRPKAAPLWQGAWVGWLTTQVVVLIALEGAIAADRVDLASALRLGLVGGVSAVFARPCFETKSQRSAFIVAVFAAEVVIAAYCNRLTPAFYGLLVGTAGVVLCLVETPSARTTARLIAETRYTTLAHLTRLASALPQRSSFWTRRRERFTSKLMRALWAATFECLEHERQRCASAVNRHRQFSQF